MDKQDYTQKAKTLLEQLMCRPIRSDPTINTKQN